MDVRNDFEELFFFLNAEKRTDLNLKSCNNNKKSSLKTKVVRLIKII